MRLEPPDADFRVGHPGALNRVLLNLTTNALKFTSSGHVEITVKSPSRSRLEFSVRDTGRGIPPDVMSSLFDPFRRRRSRRLRVLECGARALDLPQARGGDGRNARRRDERDERHAILLRARAAGGDEALSRAARASHALDDALASSRLHAERLGHRVGFLGGEHFALEQRRARPLRPHRGAARTIASARAACAAMSARMAVSISPWSWPLTAPPCACGSALTRPTASLIPNSATMRRAIARRLHEIAAGADGHRVGAEEHELRGASAECLRDDAFEIAARMQMAVGFRARSARRRASGRAARW